MIKVFFDTNVIIDYFSQRDGSDYSSSLVELVVSGKLKGYMCTKQFTDIYYCLKKYVPSNEIRLDALRVLFSNLTILPVLPSDIDYCLNNSTLDDFEDDVINEITKVNCINYIVTNNTKHFDKSKNTIISPKDLCILLNI